MIGAGLVFLVGVHVGLLLAAALHARRAWLPRRIWE